MSLSLEDQRRIGAAIKTAEAGTAGEIVCVLARASHDYLMYPAAWSALAAFVVPWVLVATTQLTVERILLIQVFAFLVLFLVLSLPPLRLRLVPRRVARHESHRAAMEQFMIRGMARKANRAGVLIFVSLGERYARIVADDGIAAKVDSKVWQGAIDALITHTRDGRIADGFVAAIDACGAVLAAHFPAGARNDELPDRIYLI